MHFKALNLVLERGREKKDNTAEEGDSPQHQSQTLSRRRSQVKRKGHTPASLPDATPFTDDAGRSNGHVCVDEIPPGLPRLHTPSEGIGNGKVSVFKCVNRIKIRFLLMGLCLLVCSDVIGRSSVHGSSGSSIRKAGSFVRPISPKSPVASGSAFESMGESDDDDDNVTDTAELDASYLQTNGDLVSVLFCLLN